MEILEHLIELTEDEVNNLCLKGKIYGLNEEHTPENVFNKMKEVLPQLGNLGVFLEDSDVPTALENIIIPEAALPAIKELLEK